MKVSSLSMVLLLFTCVAQVAGSTADNRTVYCGTQQWRVLIESAAKQFAVPPSWLEAILRAESAGCANMNGMPTISSAGAMGLMQLMPGTWERLRAELYLGHDPFDPHDNILAGAKYLRQLYDQFGLAGAIAAYHAGPGTYEQHLRTGQALPNSTLTYFSRVAARIDSNLTSKSGFAFRGASSPVEMTTRTVFVSRAGPNLDRRADPSLSRRLFIDLENRRRVPERRLPEATDAQAGTPTELENLNETPASPEAR